MNICRINRLIRLICFTVYNLFLLPPKVICRKGQMRSGVPRCFRRKDSTQGGVIIHWGRREGSS